MKTALDLPARDLDEEERHFVAALREHGWFGTRVTDDEGDDPDFSYTTGFWLSMGKPEIILFSLPPEVSHDTLWELFRDLRDGRVLPVATPIDNVFGNARAVLFPVAARHYAEHLGWNQWFYGSDDFPCLQLVWPDPAGKFPWELGFDQSYRDDQPDLSETGWAAEIIS